MYHYCSSTAANRIIATSAAVALAHAAAAGAAYILQAATAAKSHVDIDSQG
jgi:hypothetical protein